MEEESKQEIQEISLFGDDLFGDPIEHHRGKLSEEFTLPPMSILDTKTGQWQDRKRAWLSFGIASEVGRAANLLGMSDTVLGEMASEGTSIFDPVLCEMAYRWFCPPGGKILDPFAGGSVRGIVAGLLGREYTGIDLRSEQIFANYEQAEKIQPPVMPRWILGDSHEVLAADKAISGEPFDFVFSCPPYADLEVYSDDASDLSVIAAGDYGAFVEAYREIIAQACARLKPNAFACFVVGDLRDKRGAYRNFVGDTISAFQDAGLDYYNEAILVNSVGTWALRVGRIFRSTRKMGKHHQNVLVFLKGDPRKATAPFAEAERDE